MGVRYQGQANIRPELAYMAILGIEGSVLLSDLASLNIQLAKWCNILSPYMNKLALL